MPINFDEIDPQIIPKMDAGYLMYQAVESYEYRTGKKVDLSKEHQIKLDHMCLNFLRHKTVLNYNKVNRKYFNHNEKRETDYFEWFKRVNLEICKKYPHLKKAALHQIQQKQKDLVAVGSF